jgi:hypothetical protein
MRRETYPTLGIMTEHWPQQVNRRISLAAAGKGDLVCCWSEMTVGGAKERALDRPRHSGGPP